MCLFFESSLFKFFLNIFNGLLINDLSFLIEMITMKSSKTTTKFKFF